MDGAARLQPLVDKYKPTSHITPNIHNRKIPRFDRNNPIMSWGQKNLFNKNILRRDQGGGYIEEFS